MPGGWTLHKTYELMWVSAFDSSTNHGGWRPCKFCGTQVKVIWQQKLDESIKRIWMEFSLGINTVELGHRIPLSPLSYYEASFALERSHDVDLDTLGLNYSLPWVVTKVKCGIGFHIAILINNMYNMWQVTTTCRHIQIKNLLFSYVWTGF